MFNPMTNTTTRPAFDGFASAYEAAETAGMWADDGAEYDETFAAMIAAGMDRTYATAIIDDVWA
jgi:hypothetical protein